MHAGPAKNDASIGVRRLLSLLACFLSGLGCGTLYLYSAYAPQMASQLQLTTTSTSFIGMVGNLGMALSGPLAGSVVDKHGPTLPILIGLAATFLGYSSVKRCYDQELSLIPLLAGSLMLVGVGSTFSFSAIVKCAALNFPNHRGFATSVPMAAFGLSAFFISSLGSIYAPGDTSKFLDILSKLPPSLFVGCIYFIRFFPPTSSITDPIELRSNVSNSPGDHEIASKPRPVSKELRGFQLLKTSTFWAHFLVMGLIAGIGQMFIYSCGYCVRALVSHDPSLSIEESGVLHIQSLQVGLISLSSFFGRLLSGSLSDFLHNKLRYQRSWLLVGAATVSSVAQFLGLSVTDPMDLGKISVATGLAYGICYGSYPTIVGDAFGMQNFSQNWGLLALSPICTSYLFNMLFGYYYDINSTPDESGHRVCLSGKDCYAGAFRVTLFAAISVVLLSLQTIRSHRRG